MKSYIDTEYCDVKMLCVKFGILMNSHPTRLTMRKLQERIDFLQEELNEFQRGAEAKDMVEMADALIDLVYVAKGTAAMLGLPWEALWDDVQRANMAKERGIGERGHRVDLVKPVGWVPPHTLRILQLHGFDVNEMNEVDDEPTEKC